MSYPGCRLAGTRYRAPAGGASRRSPQKMPLEGSSGRIVAGLKVLDSPLHEDL